MGTCSIELVSCISKSRDLVQSHEYISVVVHLDDSCVKEGVCRGGDPELLCPLMSHSVSRSVSPVCLSFCPAVCNRRPDS